MVLSTDPKIDPKPKNLQNYFLRNSELNFKKSFILFWVMGFWAFWVFGFSVFQFSQFQEMPATLYTSRIPANNHSKQLWNFQGFENPSKTFQSTFQKCQQHFHPSSNSSETLLLIPYHKHPTFVIMSEYFLQKLHDPKWKYSRNHMTQNVIKTIVLR